jgi:LuxR family maltose regulon positive regulatory protein
MTLTPREEQLAALVQQCKMNKEIAFELGLTVGTIKEYLFRLFKKTGVPNRTGLAMWYRDRQEPAGLA